MSEIAPIRYASDGFLYTHGRRLGERRTLYGSYSLGSADFDDEKPWADGRMCPLCDILLTGAGRREPLDDNDRQAHAHAAFHGLSESLIYRLCPWDLCNFWEIASFLQSAPVRPAIRPVDEIREAHGRFHCLPGALLDDEGDPEVCDFVAIAQPLADNRGEQLEDSHERFHDRPAIFADEEACADSGCAFTDVAAFIAIRWESPELDTGDVLQDAHGRFHGLPGALLSDDCPVDRCTFWTIATAIAGGSI